MSSVAAAALFSARSAASRVGAAGVARASFATSARASDQGRSGSSSSTTSQGDFPRPPSAPSSSNVPNVRQPAIAQVHTPPHVPSTQSPNYPTTWSEGQNTREHAMRGPRFEQMEMDMQPQPLSAMAMIQREPVRLSSKRVVSCDGGGGPLGHPKIFINLDKPGPKACTYCGLKYELDTAAHH
ncbi:unnamed protein product [Tilletia controversa]|uniref:Zinc finger CHCC-type domain-containing protein n=3 Tax=Tilletia TaxID=13289 RepID=A0A8X7STF7_9BASI|nr:hypothetical protein CF336_g7717 [Tilletia laevis]KAE8186345.1 hypothetical protein CF328_g7259 [Tilletia controversa]KAE8246780.1 hypothetical protein A4X03_0g7214 [Tilletia caries]KAE8187087.1 hypothetical protein CF335_g7270 [Tilletia laevis]KAE8239806.1 hypothetical protein A4X06_0g8032 [Tilletia controversa]